MVKALSEGVFHGDDPRSGVTSMPFHGIPPSVREELEVAEEVVQDARFSFIVRRRVTQSEPVHDQIKNEQRHFHLRVGDIAYADSQRSFNSGHRLENHFADIQGGRVNVIPQLVAAGVGRGA